MITEGPVDPRPSLHESILFQKYTVKFLSKNIENYKFDEYFSMKSQFFQTFFYSPFFIILRLKFFLKKTVGS